MTNSIVTVAQAIQAKIETVATANNIKQVVYGDVDNIDSSIIACVEPDVKDTDHYRIGNVVKRDYRIYVLLYFGFVDNPENNRLNADKLAETLETLLNNDSTLGGLVRNLLVRQVASGYVRKNGVLVRSSRLTITAESSDRI